MSSDTLTDFQKAKIINVQFGKRTKVVEPCNLYDCFIGEGCFIGPFVEIQSSCKVGRNSRIQSHSFLCSKVEIGENCFIGHGVIFTNDLFKEGMPSTEKRNWLPTLIENDVSIGSGTTLLPVRIVSGCVIGAGSVITKDLEVKGIYAGNPAKLIREI
tara:strand:+ start:38 stop:508 length:471 start_codon:yes stop_codon:yes gene_type:complete